MRYYYIAASLFWTFFGVLLIVTFSIAAADQLP